MKHLWKRFLLNIELVAYNRVLKECHSILTDEHRKNIYAAIAKTKQKLTV
jgi:hypothetical protein